MVLGLVLSLLPYHLWVEIFGKYIAHGDAFPVALTCRLFKRAALSNVVGGCGGFKTPVSKVVVSLPMLQWAVSCGYRWDRLTCSRAAAGGHLEVLQWARANGCVWDTQTCTDAAANGHLAVLQWAREHGCEWDAMTCAEAVANGHLEVLKWARANGCVWDTQHMH